MIKTVWAYWLFDTASGSKSSPFGAVIGGLGSAVAEVLSSLSNQCRQIIIGINDYYEHPSSYQSLLEKYDTAMSCHFACH